MLSSLLFTVEHLHACTPAMAENGRRIRKLHPSYDLALHKKKGEGGGEEEGRRTALRLSTLQWSGWEREFWMVVCHIFFVMGGN